MIPFWKKTVKHSKPQSAQKRRQNAKPAVPRTAQQSIPMQRMFEDGTCRVKANYYTRTIQYQDINYQLAQQEDKTAIFEEWCSFLNFFDSSIKFELSFVNVATDSTEFEKSIRIPFQKDGFDDVRAEYSQMLRQQLAKGNNGLTKTKFITFGVEGESMAQVKPRLDHIQNDLLNNFHRLGVQAKPLNGVQRLKLMHDMFNMDGASKFHFDWKDLVKSGLSVKDAIAPTAFAFKNSRAFQMGGIYCAASFLSITASDISDQLLKDFLDMDSSQIVTMHIQSVDQNKAIKTVKRTITELDRSKIEEQKKAIFQPYNSAGLPNGGIGLALVKSIARLFDIRLSVESLPQRGNLFRMEMAVGQDDGAEPERPDAATGIVGRIVDNTSYFEDVSQPRFLDAEGHRKFRILLVENDADSKRVLEKRLQKHFHVSSAATGDEALLLLKSQSIDVVICDMQLADTNGFDLCGMIKNSNRTRHIPVILESFELSGENRIRALQCGADAMFQKPINLQELFLRLNNLLRTKDVLRDYYMAAGSVGITTPGLNNTDERFILSVTDYIHAHLDDPGLSVNELARFANISRTQLYLSIKRLTDRTPSDFILQIKMREAAGWLQTTAMTASEISYKLGYCNPNHFSRQFKEYYGASPGEYRRRHAKPGA